MKHNNFRYICNGEGCSPECSKLKQHYTADENYAKNRIRRNRHFQFKNGLMVEVEYEDIHKSET